MVERASKFYVVHFEGGKMISEDEIPANGFNWPVHCLACGSELNISGSKTSGYWVSCPNWTVKAHDLVKIVPIFP